MRLKFAMALTESHAGNVTQTQVKRNLPYAVSGFLLEIMDVLPKQRSVTGPGSQRAGTMSVQRDSHLFSPSNMLRARPSALHTRFQHLDK
jgi:hypothetical protein